MLFCIMYWLGNSATTHIFALRAHVFETCWKKWVISVNVSKVTNTGMFHWQISLPSPPYYESNEPIILVCVLVKITTNPSPRVRSWLWRPHECEIQVQDNKKFFFVATSRIVFSQLCSSLATLSCGEKSRKPLGPGWLWHWSQAKPIVGAT